MLLARFTLHKHKSLQKKRAAMKIAALFYILAGLTGLEPATSRVTGERSNQTELQPQNNLAPRAGLEPAT